MSWPGKETSELVVEACRPPILERWGGEEEAGSLILGDNLEALAGLEPGSVRLVYLDPPFFSEKRYSYVAKAEGEWFRVPSFEDRWGGDLGAYLSFLEDRLRLLARALSDDGSLYVHLDAAACHYVKVLLDEILGAARFSRQIVWRIGWVSGFKSRAKNWIRNHDVILYYSRPNAPFTRKLLPHPEGYARRAGQRGEGRPVDDVWLDIPSIQLMSFNQEKTGWATQKNESLLARIIEASSEPGDLVVDPFSGAGTTAVAAATLGRRFVTIDRSPLAIHLSRRRLLAASVGFSVRGEASPVVGPAPFEIVVGEQGSLVRLLDVPAARGPEGVAWRGRVDAWWVTRASEPTRPLWHAHRVLGRKPGQVMVESPPLEDLLPDDVLRVTVIDLFGARHESEIGGP